MQATCARSGVSSACGVPFQQPAGNGPGKGVEVSIGGDPNASPPVLSVAELQRALRWARRTASEPSGLNPSTTPHLGLPAIPAGWIAVCGAHPGAGVTTLAVALAETVSVAGGCAELVEVADPARSGLVAAADTELGVDSDGLWRSGQRAAVSLHRRAASDMAVSWPASLTGAEAKAVPYAPVIADLSGIDDAVIGQLSPRGAVVLAFRVSVPGARAADVALPLWAEVDHLVVAALGARRWPRPVLAGLGPQLAALRDQGRLVPVPLERRFAVTGLTPAPVPKSVRAAARTLLTLVAPACLAGARRDRHEDDGLARIGTAEAADPVESLVEDDRCGPVAGAQQ